MYADDTQLYKSVKASQVLSVLKDTTKYFVSIKAWMTLNKLKLNDAKTDIYNTLLNIDKDKYS